MLVACATAPSRHRTPSEEAAVYLVPLGPLRVLSLAELAEYYEDTLGIRVAIAREIPLRADWFNPNRRQFVAESLLRVLAARADGYPSNGRTIFLGITEAPMFIQAVSWRFAWGHRATEKFGVVSSAYMDGSPSGARATDEQVRVRARKLVTKSIGLLYYHRSVTRDPRSVLHAPILNTNHLDAIDETTIERDVLRGDERE